MEALYGMLEDMSWLIERGYRVEIDKEDGYNISIYKNVPVMDSSLWRLMQNIPRAKYLDQALSSARRVVEEIEKEE